MFDKKLTRYNPRIHPLPKPSTVPIYLEHLQLGPPPSV